MRGRPDGEPRVPFPLSDVSNGEWCPRPPSAKQRLAARLIAEECDRRAHRHGMTRAQFLRTAAGTATAFWVLNLVHGLDQWGDAAALPVNPDLGAACELLDRHPFVMDVQLHHVDLNLPNPSRFCFIRFGERGQDASKPCAERTQLLGQANFVQEVFVGSETDVGVISGVPSGVLLPPQTMADTRDLVNHLAGSERALSQAMIDPKAPPGSSTALDSMEHQVRDLGAVALKCYTYNGNWWLDDERVSYPMLAEATRLGLGLINCHKGLPNLAFFPLSAEYVRTRDLPKVVRDWPGLKFCAYHAGYFPEEGGNSEFIRVARSLPRKYRRNLYAEIGSSFAITFLESPAKAAFFIGRLLATLGSRNILWGTDCVWWGSPQWLIDAFKTLQIPAPMRERYGFPPLTRKAKRRILGLNAARLYGVDPRARRCAIAADRIALERAVQGGFRAGRSLRAYGPRTRREFLAFLRNGASLPG